MGNLEKGKSISEIANPWICLLKRNTQPDVTCFPKIRRKQPILVRGHPELLGRASCAIQRGVLEATQLVTTEVTYIFASSLHSRSDNWHPIVDGCDKRVRIRCDGIGRFNPIPGCAFTLLPQARKRKDRSISQPDQVRDLHLIMPIRSLNKFDPADALKRANAGY